MRRVAAVAALVLAMLTGLCVQAGATVDSGRRSYTGEIGGAAYRVEVPAGWNGTLVLYSHGYFPAGFPDFGITLANRPETEAWLLAHGYALAASDFVGRIGYQVRQAQQDQIALLDWFDAHVGTPRHTVSYGQSLGATPAVLLAERHPDRFDGVATVCGVPDPYGAFNANLDVVFAVRALLAPGEDIDLVRPRDAAGSTQALLAAVQRALTTPTGRARLALAGAMNGVAPWYSAHDPKPTDLVAAITAQASWLSGAYIGGLGPLARVDLERRAGGNPSSNVGVDYARQLARSPERDLVYAAYRAAGLDPRADLRRLNAAPRIAADPAAAAWQRSDVPAGTTGVPVVTAHTLGDGGASIGAENWYAGQVRRHGDPRELRQVYGNRGMHCAFNAAEEIGWLTALFTKIETGRWPSTAAPAMNAAADALGEPYRLVLDFGTFLDAPDTAEFVRFTPPRFMRPTR